MGTLMATMLPYSFAFFVVWTALMIVWIWLALPLGPEAGLFYTTGQ
ncbi:AbgT family transporter [Macellibacteroides fermentans]